MKKKIVVAIIMIVVIISAFFIGTGFQKRTDVVLFDYSVSEDGTAINLGVQVSSSMGYIRGFKNKGGGVKPHYLTFYSTFGGLNSSFGTVNSFVLEIEEDDSEIYFNRPDGGYELVLVKDIKTGEWTKPNEESEQWDLIPMVMVNGELYLDTGYKASSVRKCGTMDSEITSEVAGSKQPTENDQSNFGTGYGYQYGSREGTIEIFMNDQWFIFATEEVLESNQSTYNQFAIMAENKSMWKEDYESLGEIVNYAVMDLDKNGRFELIVSGIGGTGLYANNRIYEINESYNGLTECVTSFVGDSEPDLAYYTWDQYMDESYRFHYGVTDVERNNPYGCLEEKYDLVLENGIVKTNKIASKETIFKEAEVDYIICTDSTGKVITEEEYAKATSNYFAGCEKKVVNIGWLNMEDLAEDVDGIREQLEDSYKTLREGLE